MRVLFIAAVVSCAGCSSPVLPATIVLTGTTGTLSFDARPSDDPELLTGIGSRWLMFSGDVQPSDESEDDIEVEIDIVDRDAIPMHQTVTLPKEDVNRDPNAPVAAQLSSSICINDDVTHCAIDNATVTRTADCDYTVHAVDDARGIDATIDVHGDCSDEAVLAASL